MLFARLIEGGFARIRFLPSSEVSLRARRLSRGRLGVLEEESHDYAKYRGRIQNYVRSHVVKFFATYRTIPRSFTAR